MAETEGTYLLPILERADETTQRQIDTQENLNKTLNSLVVMLKGFQGGGVSGQRRTQSPNAPANKNPIQPQTPSTLSNVFSFMGEKKDKAVEFIKKGFFKLFKTDYFTNLLKSINNLAKAVGNALFGWLKFFIMMAFIDPSGGFLRDIINLFLKIGMILFKTIMPLIPIAIKMMFDTIIYVFKQILALMPSIITTVMKTFTQLGNTFPILKPLINFINQFLSAIRGLFIAFNDPKADKGKAIKKFLMKVFDIAVNIIKDTYNFIVPYIPKIIKFIVKTVKQFIDFITPYISQFITYVIDKFKEFITFITPYVSKMITYLAEKFGELIDFIVPYIPKMLEAIGYFLANTLIPLLIKYVPKILDAFSEGLQGLIDKYPNLKVWIQPFKDILDMISAFIGGFAKFDSGAYVKENAEYQKLEKATMQSKEFTRATEEQRLKMLSDLQYGFMVDNQQMVKDAEAQFKKQTDDKLNLAKQKWDEFLTHIMESLGKAYDNLPDIAKYALWIYGFVKLVTIVSSVIGFFTKLWSILSLLAPVGTFLIAVFKAIGLAIATFVGSLSAMTIGIIIAIAVVIGLIWYFWDDIVKFFGEAWESISKWFSETWKKISEWWDKLEILEPLKNIGLIILGFLGDLATGFYDEFIKPIGDMWDSFMDFFKNIKLPDWLSKLFGGIGGGTDASELESSERARSLQANPYSKQSLDKQNKMVLNAKQKELDYLYKNPSNYRKLLNAEYTAKSQSGFFKTQADISTDYIKKEKPSVQVAPQVITPQVITPQVAPQVASSFMSNIAEQINIKPIASSVMESISSTIDKIVNFFSKLSNMKISVEGLGISDFFIRARQIFSSIGNYLYNSLPDIIKNKITRTAKDKLFDVENYDSNTIRNMDVITDKIKANAQGNQEFIKYLSDPKKTEHGDINTLAMNGLTTNFAEFLVRLKSALINNNTKEVTSLLQTQAESKVPMFQNPKGVKT